jgi:hypothetical protein
MKFIEVHTIDGGLYAVEKKLVKIYININHIISFQPYYYNNGEISYDRTIITLIGYDDRLIIKANFENFKDNILKLHSNHTHIV